MSVDLSPLQRAVARLEEGLGEFRSEPTRTIVRDGLIQRFEFTYDLAPKILRRVLVADSNTPAEIEAMTFPALMRAAFEKGLVDEAWQSWLDYREKRNITSHAYDESLAKGVAMLIPAFLAEVRGLLERLESFTAK